MCLLAAGAQANDAADVKPTGVYLPTTPNDYSGMIYSLLQEQTNRVMNKDGATVRSCTFTMIPTATVPPVCQFYTSAISDPVC